MKIFYFILLVMAIFLLPGCNKYPDGPFFSIYTASARISGDWELKYLYENGLDISQPFKNSTCYSKFHFILERKDSGNGRFYCDKIIFGDDTCKSDGYWTLSSSKKNLTMYAMNKSTYFPSLGPIFKESIYPDYIEIKWRIRRLTFKDFWMTTTYNNKDYELIFGK